MSVTTLEEVFLRVARGEETDHKEKALIRRSSKLREHDMDVGAAGAGAGAHSASPRSVTSEAEVDYHDGCTYARSHHGGLVIHSRGLYLPCM